MVNEMFDIIDVKNEYVSAVGNTLKQQFSIQAIEAGFVLLNDFCNNIRSNDLVLVKVQTEQPRLKVPQRIPEKVEEYEMSEEEDLVLRQEYERRIKAEDMKKKVSALNKNLMEEPPQMPNIREDINLTQQRPKSFIDKVKSYKPSVDQVNDDDD